MKRILVTGGRCWIDAATIREALLAHGPGIVVHGACRGADAIAERVAQALGFPTEAHPANWYPQGRLDKAAGNRRNAEMVKLGADICLAFPDPASKGTWNCVDLAKKASIPVQVFQARRNTP